MVRERILQVLALGFMVLYFGVSYLGWFALDALSPYAMYGFELGFAAILSWPYRPFEFKKAPFGFGAAVALFFALVSGFAVYEFAPQLGGPVPFEMKDPETVLFLLLVGPRFRRISVSRSALAIGANLDSLSVGCICADHGFILVFPLSSHGFAA